MAETRTIILVRHGAAASPPGDRFSGRQDFPLSDTGHAQASAVAAHLSDRKIDSIICSPLARAVQTARAIGAPHHILPRPDDSLTDIDCGEWTGHTLDEVTAGWPAQWSTWLTDPASAMIPGGESICALMARVEQALDRIDVPCAVVVSHRAPLKLAILMALGAGPAGFWRIRLDTASVSEIRLGSQTQVVRINTVVMPDT